MLADSWLSVVAVVGACHSLVGGGVPSGQAVTLSQGTSDPWSAAIAGSAPTAPPATVEPLRNHTPPGICRRQVRNAHPD